MSSTTARRSGSGSADRSPPPPLVLLDANALFLPSVPGIPVADEVERLLGRVKIAVPSSVVAELDRLVERRMPGARTARALAARFPVLSAPGRGDGAVVGLAVRRGAIVVTVDREMRRHLREAGLSVMGPRGKRRLELVAGVRIRAPRPSTPRSSGNGYVPRPGRRARRRVR